MGRPKVKIADQPYVFVGQCYIDYEGGLGEFMVFLTEDRAEEWVAGRGPGSSFHQKHGEFYSYDKVDITT